MSQSTCSSYVGARRNKTKINSLASLSACEKCDVSVLYRPACAELRNLKVDEELHDAERSVFNHRGPVVVTFQFSQTTRSCSRAAFEDWRETGKGRGRGADVAGRPGSCEALRPLLWSKA